MYVFRSSCFDVLATHWGGESRLVWYGAFGDLSMSHCALIVDDDEHTLYFIEQVLRPL